MSGSDLLGVDWAAFDEAQDPGERPALRVIYPAYQQWFEAQQRRYAGAASGPAETAKVQVVERIVERQILVERCRFCGELTPVDLKHPLI